MTWTHIGIGTLLINEGHVRYIFVYKQYAYQLSGDWHVADPSSRVVLLGSF